MFVRQKRGAKKRPKARAKSKAKAGARIPRPRLPQALEQRHLDLIGLFLIAAGAYLSFVLFFGWEGGKVGYGVETGLTYLVGDVGARIFTVLMLVIGVVLVTGTSIGSILRGFGRGTRRVVVGSRGMAETVVRTREDRATEPETRAGPTPRRRTTSSRPSRSAASTTTSPRRRKGRRTSRLSRAMSPRPRRRPIRLLRRCRRRPPPKLRP